MKLDVLHRAKLKYGEPSVGRKVKIGGGLELSGLIQKHLDANHLASQMSGHEVPHMDGTNGHVPKPGKPKWEQSQA